MYFISLSRYFRLWRVMPQIKEPVSNKFNEKEDDPCLPEDKIPQTRFLKPVSAYMQEESSWNKILQIHIKCATLLELAFKCARRTITEAS